ncbi:hypothetical protein L596_018616 [Steinernema carpocapsae]|uniref:Choline/carnitine acyltransferase domain-containing protein n=1 Tax=Steinernema carpocapsae TaxID=34508 RepID=A0A4U5N5N9_STECR|nr:hypothetical protein L596_018616 [Steinernema carpocapsae]
MIGDESRNRWFDKYFQLIVDGNEQATINFEHFWGDGVAVLRLMNESLSDTNTNHFVGPESQTSGKGHVKELIFPEVAHHECAEEARGGGRGRGHRLRYGRVLRHELRLDQQVQGFAGLDHATGHPARLLPPVQGVRPDL